MAFSPSFFGAGPKLSAADSAAGKRLASALARGPQGEEQALKELAEHPLAAAALSSSGEPMLHLAMQMGASPRIVATLLKAYPEGAHSFLEGDMDDVKSWTAVGVATHRTPLASFKLVLEAMGRESLEESPALFNLLERRQASDELVVALLQFAPGLAKRGDLVVDEETGDAERIDRDGILEMSPLAAAIYCGAGPAVVAELLRLAPEAVSESDSLEMLPAHFVTGRTQPESLKLLLAAMPPELLDTYDGPAATPLAESLNRYRQPNNACLLQLIEKRPQAVGIDCDLSFALPLALRKGASRQVIEAMLRACPEAVKQQHNDPSSRERKLLLPIHCLRKDTELATVQLLLQTMRQQECMQLLLERTETSPPPLQYLLSLQQQGRPSDQCLQAVLEASLEAAASLSTLPDFQPDLAALAARKVSKPLLKELARCSDVAWPELQVQLQSLLTPLQVETVRKQRAWDRRKGLVLLYVAGRKGEAEGEESDEGSKKHCPEGK